MAHRNTRANPEPSPYELVFKATNDLLYDLDIPSGSVTWNEALQTQYGYESSPAVTTVEWWSQHIHPDDALRIEKELTEWLEGPRDTWQAEYRFRKADGSYNYVRDRGYVLRDDRGEPVRIIGSFLDITRQHELENAKDEFISLVSHQLRTPLTVIRTYGDMLQSGFYGRVPAAQRTPIQSITSASVRLIELVSDILNISKLEMNAITVQPRPTDVNQLVSEQIAELAPLLSGKKLRVHFRPSRALGEVRIDAMLVRQILHNLLTNSIRYTKPGEGEITVKTSARGRNFTISVHDNGIGIPPAAQNQVFNRFYRANNAENIEQHGTGLGLYLVKLLAEACQGSIWFESVEKQGSTFYLRLPR